MTNIQAIFSPCHNAFIYYNDDTLICTVCKKVIGRLQEDEEIVTNIEYNVDEDKESVNIYSDLNSNVIHVAKRHFDDITAELCLIECPICKSPTRIYRDLHKNKIFICTNGKCKNVFKLEDVKNTNNKK